MIRAVLDACVLYPPVLRGLLLGADRAGLYRAQWSDRIIEEWLRATRKLGPAAEAEARLQAALVALQLVHIQLGHQQPERAYLALMLVAVVVVQKAVLRGLVVAAALLQV